MLVREDNGLLNCTYIYAYDNAGNITSSKKYSLTASGVTPSGTSISKTYGYSTSEWGDLLTSYNGNTITYDAIGNPLNYYNNGTSYTFTWSGRRLVGATTNSKTMSFTYDDNGIRTSKTVNGVTTTYYLNGSQIVGEETNGNVTIYLYDANGAPIGFQYHASTYASGTWDVYWYEKNLQGDIVAVYSNNGTKLISYVYDAWGYTYTNYHNSGSSTTAVNNPFTYRGYYFDKDLNLYYLQSRYYDASVRRFISPDHASVLTATPNALTDKNLYAYCDNNPVMRVDGDGEFWNWLVGGVVGTIGAAIVASAQGKTGDEFWGAVANGAISGAVAGLAADVIILTGGTAGVIIAAGAVAGGIGSGLGSITEDLIVDNEINWSDVGVDVVFGTVTGALFGSMSGPQKNMIQEVSSKAGAKAISRGITFGYAASKTSLRELRNIGPNLIEECISSFTSWLLESYVKSKIGR